MESLGKKVLCFIQAALLVALAHFFFLCPPSQAQGRVRLKEVRVQGNLRVEEDAIRFHLKARPGDLFDPAIVERDVKAIYQMGFFDDVKVDLSPDGALTYQVKERPYVREIKIQGYDKLGKDKIETAFGIKPRTVLDRDKVGEGVERVRRLYAEQGYMSAQVDFAISLAENNQAAILLHIEEGARLLIQKISFQGNRAFSERQLKGLMATKERWFLSFLTNRGVLDQDALTNDLAILSFHYYDHGYIRHKIDEPVILKRKEGIEVVIRIEEGDPYRVGKVGVGGDLLEEGEKLLQKVQLTTGQIFRGSRLREDIATLTELYASRGFAFAKVDPQTQIDAGEKKVDVALIIDRGPPVYFNRIVIQGNTKTRDKVIRREMTVAEQELFSASKIKQSRNALQRTGYFEEVQLSTQKSDLPDALDLMVDVKEGPTGMFSVGAGYGSGDQFFLATSVTERNLFGRGQSLSASFDIGSVRQDFVLSFTEPYLLDSRLSLGMDAFNTRREFTDFTSRRTGFSTRTSYPLKYLPFFSRADSTSTHEGVGALPQSFSLVEYLRAGLTYELTREKIGNIDSDASASIQSEEGISWTSSLTPGLSYDSRDHFFTPTEGTYSNLALKFAGLGGDSRFLKTDATGRWYYSPINNPKWGGAYTLSLGGSVGYGVGLKERANGEKNLPLFERYFPGGMNSVRGFKERSLGPLEGDDPVGGDKQFLLSTELVFPIWEPYGLRGVTFFDAGQAFGASDPIRIADFRMSTGVGIRWLSPLGPLRLEFGFPLNKKPGDETSVVGFSVGGRF